MSLHKYTTNEIIEHLETSPRRQRELAAMGYVVELEAAVVERVETRVEDQIVTRHIDRETRNRVKARATKRP